MMYGIQVHVACWMLVAGACCGIAGCEKENKKLKRFTGPAFPITGSDMYGDPEDIVFSDTATTNVQTVEDLANLSFSDIDGKSVLLKEFLGEKNVVLVITRGYAGSICMYCSTQTSRLISNYEEFSKRGTEVVVAFPISTEDDKDKLEKFVESAREILDVPVEEIPFPVLLDLKLEAVNQLGIRRDLAKPATYILDKQGQVRFAYVGNSISERPSVKAILAQLDELNSEAQGTARDATQPAEPQ